MPEYTSEITQSEAATESYGQHIAGPDADQFVTERVSERRERIGYEESWDGLSIPPPIVLESYKQVDPAYPDRLMSMTEKIVDRDLRTQERAFELEEFRVRSHLALNSRGQLLGFFLALVAVVCGAVVAALGQPWAGGFFGSGGIVLVVLAFVKRPDLLDQAEIDSRDARIGENE